MPSPNVPLLTLNNGVQMPAFGLGVFQSPPAETAAAVGAALASGYRLIDTAAFYHNERQVGEGVRRSGLDRAEVFVTTKLWITDYGYDQAFRAFDASMSELGLDYLDLYLLHWPTPSNFANTVAAYRAAEKMLQEGRVRAIGVSNFNPHHLQDLMAQTVVVPALNQVEIHPFFSQPEIRAANARLGIVTQSWSPIGGVFINQPRDPSAITRVLDDPCLNEIAARHKKSPAQAVLRWHIQHGLAVIPKSVHRDRIAANIDIFDFELSAEDMAAIDALDRAERGGLDPDVFGLAALDARLKKQSEQQQ
jgi:diketogulonate reductase-like aldo/keto reductase